MSALNDLIALVRQGVVSVEVDADTKHYLDDTEYLAGQLAVLYYEQRNYHMTYVLSEDGEPVPTDDMQAVHALLYDIKARTVAKTRLAYRGSVVEISTVFLVFNHSYLMDGPPVLWETMVFARHPDLNGWQDHYISREKAEAGHERAVAAAWRVLRRKKHSPRRAKVAQRRLALVQGGRR